MKHENNSWNDLFCSFTSLFHTQIWFSWFTIHIIFWPSNEQCSCHHSHHHEKPHLAMNFNLRDSVGSQKCNHGTLLKAHRQVLYAGFHFILPMKVKELVLQNMSQFVACQGKSISWKHYVSFNLHNGRDILLRLYVGVLSEYTGDWQAKYFVYTAPWSHIQQPTTVTARHYIIMAPAWWTNGAAVVGGRTTAHQVNIWALQLYFGSNYKWYIFLET
jgi:hypothetical protein